VVLGSNQVTKRLVYICDWLPPDFGAVGQYAVLFARQWATEGWTVTLVGLTSGNSKREAPKPAGMGTVQVIAVHRPKYEKQRFLLRMAWTVISNVLLLKAAFGAMRRADVVLFTGSPPLMLHFIAPLNILLGKQLIYRITDFHPECLIADGGWRGPLAEMVLRLTRFWRRRIDQFEVLGVDQAQRLIAMGISEDRIVLKRDPSPVTFSEKLIPLDLPRELKNARGVILYSGNWGVAHDDTTFIQAYAEYRRGSDHGLTLWVNAVGVKADGVERALRAHGAPMHRSSLVPLEDLPRLLLAVDVHLITLRDAFVGYVLPSKIHACIESGKRILFVGSENSDVHLLASQRLSPEGYCRVDVGDVEGLVKKLQALEQAVVAERKSKPSATG
jgi:Glycosyl transferase 4-like domain